MNDRENDRGKKNIMKMTCQVWGMGNEEWETRQSTDFNRCDHNPYIHSTSTNVSISIPYTVL